jgi:hypothetical protein
MDDKDNENNLMAAQNVYLLLILVTIADSMRAV